MPAFAPPVLDFRGYRVAVAGASRGIGRAIALAFAQAGVAVSVCARGAEALEDTRRAIAAHGVPAHAQRCDLGEAADIEAYVAGAANALGGLDVLVNNATGYGFSDDDAGWQAGINVDLLAAVRASRAALEHLKASGKASILHTASIAAFYANVRNGPYGAVKAALVHYTKAQALSLAEHGIRVNAIAPGSIEFPGGLWERRRQETPEVYRNTLAKIPFGRFGQPGEIAHVALFLASPLAGWITGQTIAVDGGQLLNS